MARFSPLIMTMVASLIISNMNANEEEHIKPGTRAVAHTEWLKVQEERENQEKNGVDESTLPAPEQEVKEENVSNLQACKTLAGIKYTSHTGVFYNPIMVSALGDQVELNDGSIWSIKGADTLNTLNWYTSDLIVITPNHEWFSSYLFKMTNQNTGVAVRCNLTLGPIYNGLYTHWIVAINYYTNEVCLEDGSIFQVSGFDSSTLCKWLINDTIILGVNDGFLSASKPNILINVNTLTYARAKCTW